MKICMVTGLQKLGRMLSFTSAGGMGTQVPMLAERLRSRGFEVSIDDPAGCDVIHLHNPMPQFVPLIFRAKKRGTPVVIHARHLPELVKGGFKFESVIHPLFSRYSRWLYNQADLVICATPYVRRWMEDNRVSSALTVIPNGVNLERFAYSEEKRQRFREQHGVGDRCVVFSVGLLIPRKGVHDFIETARRLPPGDYAFFWAGSSEPGLERVDTSDAPDNVTFLGHVPFDRIGELYSGGDIFFFPTHAESYGNVLFEAAAAERLLLIRDIDIYRSWLRHGENCLKGDSADTFAEAIEQMRQDGEMRERLRQGARKLAEEHDISRTVDLLADVYTRLVS
jgi:1,2-diacylglycerol-3-alpha-glucose alpha-1,2-glucosyltransferase